MSFISWILFFGFSSGNDWGRDLYWCWVAITRANGLTVPLPVAAAGGSGSEMVHSVKWPRHDTMSATASHWFAMTNSLSLPLPTWPQPERTSGKKEIRYSKYYLNETCHLIFFKWQGSSTFHTCHKTTHWKLKKKHGSSIGHATQLKKWHGSSTRHATRLKKKRKKKKKMACIIYLTRHTTTTKIIYFWSKIQTQAFIHFQHFICWGTWVFCFELECFYVRKRYLLLGMRHFKSGNL